ncbi:hypothetical protein [Nocardioides sp. B-3]|uniref:hypothetical protein n=1 Tax=Nocardioides sp. B-3 TaxID=2895565 RepID=UPI00300E3C3B
MLLAEIVATSTAVAATRSRKAKVAALADPLRHAVAEGPEELETVVSYLGGTLRQRRTGLGWRGMSDLPDPATEPALSVTEVHEAFEELSAIAGAGSQNKRKDAVNALFARATDTEQARLRGPVTGEVRRGRARRARPGGGRPGGGRPAPRRTPQRDALREHAGRRRGGLPRW